MYVCLSAPYLENMERKGTYLRSLKTGPDRDLSRPPNGNDDPGRRLCERHRSDGGGTDLCWLP